MKFRRYLVINRTCTRNLGLNIHHLMKENLAHLMNPENVHSYEHGLKVEYKDVDQNVRQMEMTSHEAKGELMVAAIKSGDFPSAVNFLDTLSKSVSDQIAKSMFAKIEEITQETGNVVNNNGQPLSGDTIIKGLEMTGVHITKDGKVSVPQLVTGPELAGKAAEIQNDPEFQKKLQEVFERKLQEALKEEQNRKSKFPAVEKKK